MLRCKISPDHECLNKLHEQFKWIPNSENIRPTPAVLEAKVATLEIIDQQWMSCKDFILHKVFKRECKKIVDRYYVPDMNIDETTIVFAPNEFPYSIETGNHWVLWYGCIEQPYSDDRINMDVNKELQRVLEGSQNYDFAWYENPKMSIPDFYHIHVFWTTTSG